MRPRATQPLPRFVYEISGLGPLQSEFARSDELNGKFLMPPAFDGAATQANGSAPGCSGVVGRELAIRSASARTANRPARYVPRSALNFVADWAALDLATKCRCHKCGRRFHIAREKRGASMSGEALHAFSRRVRVALPLKRGRIAPQVHGNATYFFCKSVLPFGQPPHIDKMLNPERPHSVSSPPQA